MAEGIIIRRGIAPAEVVEYITATGGTTLEYNEGGKRYKSHTFTSSGNFVVSSLGSTPELNAVDYLIVAGGGGGGAFAGGGGAGGYRTTNGTSGGNTTPESKVTVTAQNYTVTIGAGASGATSSWGQGLTGGNSSVFSITSNGGGGGGGNGASTGNPGGSGGGSGSPDAATGSHLRSPGNGIAGQGFNGGFNSQSTARASGGGGGAGEIGQTSPLTGGYNFTTGAFDDNIGGKGGDGLGNTLRNGSVEFRGGGGAGGLGRIAPGGGGLGGGASSFYNDINNNNAVVYQNVAGAPNTGGGGGGGRGPTNAICSGGSGIVIIRYEIAPSA